MTLERNKHLNKCSIYVSSKSFTDYLSNQQNYCLFLDIDGTLAEFTLDPKDSFIAKTTLDILQQLQSCGVKIAIVTGRSLVEAEQMLAPLSLPIAATHGLEISFDTLKHQDNDFSDNNSIQIDTKELAAIKQALTHHCLPYDELSIEDKPFSVALHFRQNPTLADVAQSIMAVVLQSHENWSLKQGKYVVEIVPKGVNKGAAILTLLKTMQTDDELCPIFIGDDITDEAGFRAIQSGIQSNNVNNSVNNHVKDKNKPLNLVRGIGIKVGSDPTCADFYVHSIDEVTSLLESFLAFCKTRTIAVSPSVSQSIDPHSSAAIKTMRSLI